MTFAVDIRHWPRVQDLVNHLHAHDPAICHWATEVVYHHTIKPTMSQWKGHHSCIALQNYYQHQCRWNAGPHLFVAPDGIWQLTPLNLPGIHANAANPRSWGIEVVGNYDLEGWSPKIECLAIGAGAALLRWRGLGVDARSVNGHRKYNPKKTCPGRLIDMDWVRHRLRACIECLPGPEAR